MTKNSQLLDYPKFCNFGYRNILVSRHSPSWREKGKGRKEKPIFTTEGERRLGQPALEFQVLVLAVFEGYLIARYVFLRFECCKNSELTIDF